MESLFFFNLGIDKKSHIIYYIDVRRKRPMKYRKEFKEQVIKTRLYSLMSFDYEIADAYHISVATLKRWMKEFWAERNKEAEGI